MRLLSGQRRSRALLGTDAVVSVACGRPRGHYSAARGSTRPLQISRIIVRPYRVPTNEWHQVAPLMPGIVRGPMYRFLSPTKRACVLVFITEGSGGAYIHSGVLVRMDGSTFDNKAGEDGRAILSLGIAENISEITLDANTFYCSAGLYGYESEISAENEVKRFPALRQPC